MIEVLEEGLPQEVYDICRSTFDTHLGMEGMTGKGLQPDFRKTECRYIQRAKRVGQPQPRGLQLMEEWINDWGYPDYTPEILQIARYHVGHFYKWHTDGSGRGYRKLSLTSLLNPPSEYEGGEFEFRMPNRIAGDLVMEGQKTVMKLKERDVLLFTPELEHQVLPVLGGQRDSLVIWFIEKP
jgi:hypothetical protein